MAVEQPPFREQLVKEDGTLSDGWVRWIQQLHTFISAANDAGTTANRPTKNLWVGRPYFDTDLGYQVIIESLNPTVWIPGSGETTEGGTTANRPTSNLSVGQTYFDTDLGYLIAIESLSPTVWVKCTGDTDSGTTAARPTTGLYVGKTYWNTTLERMESVTSLGPTVWEDCMGTNAKGNTAGRPSSPYIGQFYYDTTVTKPIWWNGDNWKDGTGSTV